MAHTYRQTCTNNHLHKTIIVESAQASSHKRDQRPLFVTQIKKNLSKTTTADLFPAKKWEKNENKTNVILIIFTCTTLWWHVKIHSLLVTPPRPQKGNSIFKILIVKIFCLKKKSYQILPATIEKVKVCSFEKTAWCSFRHAKSLK